MLNKTAGRRLLLASSALIALSAIPGNLAWAQDNETDETLTVGKVIVTATRREEDAQKVPIAVSSISSEQLENSLIHDTNSLQKVAPSLIVTVSNSETTGGVLRIRGVGTAGQNPGLESAVGAFVDGVYRARPGQALNDLLDIKQIDVLRGPQGTLFGKNTSAGAIVVTTNEPEFEWGGSILAGFGNYGQQRYMGVVTGPIVEDKLAFRLAGVVNRRDGFVTDVNTGADYNDRDRYTLRGQLLATPSEDLSLRLIVDYTEKDEICCASPYVVNGIRAPIIESLGGTVFEPTREDDLVVALNTAPTSNIEDFGISAHADWDLGFGMLKVIASTRNFIATRNVDVDGMDLDLANLVNDRAKNRLDTIEATLQGTNGAVDWLVGAYAYEDTYNNPSSQLMGSDLGAFIQGFYPLPIANLYQAGDGDLARRFYQDNTGWSLFTHNEISLTDRLTATIGLRYLEEDKDGGGMFTVQATPACTSPLVIPALRVICPVPDYEASYSDDALTYTGALTYEFTPDIVGYTAYSKGYKSGGISLNRDAGTLSTQTFRPEESNNYEIGLKTEWLDDRLMVNVTGFRLEFTDYQSPMFTGTETILSNQGSLLSQGIELETRYRPMSNLSLNAATTFADTQYGDDVANTNLAGKQLNGAPKWTVQLGGSYDRRLNENLTFFASANARYQSGTNTGGNLDPLKYQDGYTLVDARLGFRFPNQKAAITLWGKNLTDERYSMIIYDSVFQTGSLQAFLGDPRTWGIEFSKQF